jgi:hypothetical protein
VGYEGHLCLFASWATLFALEGVDKIDLDGEDEKDLVERLLIGRLVCIRLDPLVDNDDTDNEEEEDWEGSLRLS